MKFKLEFSELEMHFLYKYILWYINKYINSTNNHIPVYTWAYNWINTNCLTHCVLTGPGEMRYPSILYGCNMKASSWTDLLQALSFNCFSHSFKTFPAPLHNVYQISSHQTKPKMSLSAYTTLSTCKPSYSLKFCLWK